MFNFVINIQLYFIFLVRLPENKSEKPRIIFISDNNKVIAGESLLISCISSGNPVPDITWYINRMSIVRITKSTSESSINRYHNRYLSINFKENEIAKSTLIFKQVLLEDNNSFLTCESKNVMGKDDQKTKLNVYEKKNDLFFPIVTLEDNSKSRLKRKNSQVNLQCFHNNAPNARVYWYKDYEFISKPEYEISEEKNLAKLSIKNILPKDEGSYKCLVVNQVGGQMSQPVNIKISDIPPSTKNVTVTDKSATSATICWLLSISLSIIEEFLINYETKTQTDSLIISVDKLLPRSNGFDCYLLKNLKPYTTYKVWIISSNSLGKSDPGVAVSFDTLEDLPDDVPKSITASAISNTAVEVRWKPVERINGILKKYILRYTEHPDLPNQHWRHFDSKINSSLISHLTPNKIHHITIQAVNNVGKGPLSRPVAILTKSGTISECPEFRATLILLDRIKLEWEEPDPSRLLKCLGLQLESMPVNGEKKTFNINANQYSYEISNIKEDTEIICVLRAFNQDGLGMPVKLTIQSAGKAKINKNVIEVLERTAFTIVTRWRKPNKDAMNMTLQLWENNGQLTNSIRSYKLQNYKINYQIDSWNIFNFTRLKPNQKYHIRLTYLLLEKSNVIRESFYVSNIIETQKSYPQAVGYFNLNILKDGKGIPIIHAEWEDVPNLENLTSVTLYHIKYRISYPEELSTRFQSKIINSTSCIISVADLPKYGVTYEVILSRNGNHNSKLEAQKFIKMPEEKPSKSPIKIHISNMTENSVEITYEYPPTKHRNGKIILFEVELKYAVHEKTLEIINTTKTTIAFYNLQLRPYRARIRAYTSVGCGPWSEYLEFTVHDVDISPPKNIKAYRIMDSRIKVEWSMGYDQYLVPHAFSKTVMGFVLYYGTRDTINVTTAWKQIKICENIFSYEIKNVQGNDFYIVRMSSIDKFNRIGIWSPPAVPENIDLSLYNVKTFSNLQCFLITSNTVEIRGDYPIDIKYLSSVSVSYHGKTVYWSSSNSETVDIIPEKKLSMEHTSKEQAFSINLKELVPNTKYVITVVPVYSSEFKLDSNITLSTSLICETKSEAPKFIPSPEVVLTSTYEITFKIFRVEERFGKVDNYHLIIVPYKSKSNTIFTDYNKSPNKFSLIELSSNINEKNKIQPFLAFSETTSEFFNKQSSYKFVLNFKNPMGENQKKLVNGNLYRSTLRACVQTEEGQYLCNSSDWSKSFQINYLSEVTKTKISKITENYHKIHKFNEQTIITLSIILTGILLAVMGIIIGCVVHKRKSSHKKWDNPCRSSAPELLQDAQMTPLVDVSSQKLDQEMFHLQTDQNYGFDTNNEILNFKGYMNNSMVMNHLDSPIPMKSKTLFNQQDIAPDIVNACDGFNFFNSELPQMSTNASSKYVISISNLADYIEELKNYDSLNLMQEFEDLNKETFTKFASIYSNLPQNKMKNRYANVVAYDHSIVMLQNQLDLGNNNYINANYIHGYGKQNEYIATQGPLPETINEFWQMIWEQRTSIIVMLVQVEESESKKCEMYWPTRGARMYSDIEVTLLSTMSRAYYIIRKFQLKQNGFTTKRQVYHLQFTGWPDQGIPILCIPFISFLKIYRSFNKLDCGPTVVHCSAGIGRTGIFIAIDSQIERIKNEKTLNVYEQIKSMRKQRNYMVQTEAQYGFIYDILLEWSQEKFPDINPDTLTSHIKTKSKIVEGHTFSGFEIEFQMLNMQSLNTNDNMSRIHGNAAVNKQKNNSPHLIPFDWNRVTLSSISGVEGSDYINASFVDSYCARKAYIVTQDPMASTVEDFWRLVWDKNCSIIIVLGKIEEFVKEISLPYWPIQKSIRYQFFVVDPIVEYNMSNYIMREFKVTDARDGEFKTIRQFHYSKWLNNVCPCDAHSFLEFIHQVQLTKDNFGHGNPLLVHCSYGTGKSGIFIAVNNIMEKLKHENTINVFTTVKLLHQQRIGLVQTVDQYKFCYLSLLTHLIDINPDLKSQFCGFKEYMNISSHN